MSRDIFISYSSKDQFYADALCAGLEANRIRCWIAHRDLLPGPSYGGAIVETIRRVQAMVIVLSKNSNASVQVLNEVERAGHEGKIIIPFRIDNVALSSDMEYFLSTRNWLNAMSPPLESHIARLVETTQALLHLRGPVPPVVPPLPPREGTPDDFEVPLDEWHKKKAKGLFGKIATIFGE